MNEYEKVEKLREKTNVTYEEAKAALEQSNWDLLDAIVQLEREGKISNGSAHHSTKSDSPASEPEPEPRSRFAERAIVFCEQITKLIRICNRNHFAIHYKDKQVMTMPVTVLILLLMCLHFIGLIALAAGLFFGLRYSIVGSELGKPAVNDVMDKAANAAENVRETVEESLRKE